MAEKKAAKKTTTVTTVYNITKTNGRVIQRTDIDDTMLKRYKENGWKVEAV